MNVNEAILAVLLGAILFVTAALTPGCATSSYRKNADGTVIAHVGALGEGALGSICFDELTSDTVTGATLHGPMTIVQTPQLPVELATKLKAEQSEAILEELRYSQYPAGGQCIAARGASISKELEGVLRYYLWSKAIGSAGDLVGALGDAVTTDAAADATSQVISAESDAVVNEISAGAGGAASP